MGAVVIRGVCACVCMYIYTYIDTCIHISIFIHTHMHIFIPKGNHTIFHKMSPFNKCYRFVMLVVCEYRRV